MGWDRFALLSNSVSRYGKTGLIFKPDTIIINHQLEFSGTRVKYLDHEKMAYIHDIWSIAYPKKPLIIAHSGVSERLDVSKFFGVVFNLQTLFMREKKALARSCIRAGSSEPSPYADVIRTIISCADQSIVLIFHCGPLFSFLIQYYNLNVQISKHCQSAYI